MKNITFLFLMFFTAFTPAQASLENDTTIILSEVMFAAKSGDNEFIELYNTSESDSIDLKNFQIIYYTSNPDIITNAGMGTVLPPKSFAVIFEGDYDLANGIYKDIVPGSALVLKISDNAFGSRGMANSSDRKIQLFNSDDNLIDEYTYSANNSLGFSDEKIMLDRNSSNSNWDNSITENGTPGFKNSITPAYNDLGIIRFTSDDPYQIFDTDENFNITIKNLGINNSKDYKLKVYLDRNKDSIAQTSEEIKSFSGRNLVSGDSIIFNFAYSGFSEGNNFLIAEIESQNDENFNNNSAELIFPVIKLNESRNDIVINEIMYAPTNGMPEWIEIYNNSNKQINLNGYQLSDDSDTSQIIFNEIIIKPNNFYVISSDSIITNYFNISSGLSIAKFPTLNNTGDKIILLDSLNRVIDSLQYSNDWGGNDGFSLERISYSGNSTDKSNWRTSISNNKATPGEINSVVNLKSYNKEAMVINEIMFDPAPDNSEFLEFINTTNQSINLGGWHFVDESENLFYLSNFNRKINPHQYFVIAADSSILKNYNFQDDSALNILNISSLRLPNTEGIIVLKDANGNSIDSVKYNKNWHNTNFTITQNKSIEKINPYLDGNNSINWSTSTDINGATPGKQNSIFTTSPQSTVSVSVSPNPFSPDNDGFEDFTIIKYSISGTIAQMKVKIFDSHGRLVRTIRSNSATGQNGSVVFDGLDDNNNPLRIGIYIALIEAVNKETGTTEKIKTPVVVAKKF